MIAKALSTSRRYAELHRVAGKLAEFCQALYPLLVAHADDFGRLPGDAFTVKHAVVPTSPRREREIVAALRYLHAVGLVEWYVVDGANYLQINNFEAHQVGLHKRTASVFPDPSGKFPEIPSEGKGREQKGTELKGREENGAVAPESLVALWNEITKPPIPRCRGLSRTRRSHVQARLQERPLAEWRTILERIQASSFCRGEIPPSNGRRDPFLASFDWLIASETVALKVLEGKYDDRTPPRPPPSGRTGAAPAGKYAGVERS